MQTHTRTHWSCVMSFSRGTVRCSFIRSVHNSEHLCIIIHSIIFIQTLFEYIIRSKWIPHTRRQSLVERHRNAIRTVLLLPSHPSPTCCSPPAWSLLASSIQNSIGYRICVLVTIKFHDCIATIEYFVPNRPGPPPIYCLLAFRT